MTIRISLVKIKLFTCTFYICCCSDSLFSSLQHKGDVYSSSLHGRTEVLNLFYSPDVVTINICPGCGDLCTEEQDNQTELDQRSVSSGILFLTVLKCQRTRAGQAQPYSQPSNILQAAMLSTVG